MLLATLRQLAAWRPGGLAWNTAHASSWNLARVVLQASTLVLMARSFGAAGYGALAGAVALFATIAQRVGLGSGISLVRHIARHGELPGKLRSTQLAYLITSVGLFLIAWPISWWLLGRRLDATTLGLLAAAEIIAAPALLPLAFRYQAEERLNVSGALQAIAPLARLISTFTVLALGLHGLEWFALLNFGCVVIAVATLLPWLWPRGPDAKKRHRLSHTLREGLPYAVSGLATTAGSELDKTIMLRMVGDTATGHYAAAYRLVMAATLPVNSLMLAAAPRLFGQHRLGLSSLHSLLIFAAIIYGLLASAAVLVFAPLLPYMLGPQFIASVTLLKWLCIPLVTTCARQIVTMELTTSDQQFARNIIEVVAVSFLVVGLLVLVPRAGAYAAIICNVASDCFVLTASYWCIRRTYRLRQASTKP